MGWRLRLTVAKFVNLTAVLKGVPPLETVHVQISVAV